MIFQHTYQQVLACTKTQTRRIVKPGEFASVTRIPLTIHAVWMEKPAFRGNHEPGELVRGIWTIFENCNRLKWLVKRPARSLIPSRTYAVQPGRGEHSLGRFYIPAIYQQDLLDITEHDAALELGLPLDGSPFVSYREWFLDLWDDIAGPGWRVADNPLVWVLHLEMVPAGEGRA